MNRDDLIVRAEKLLASDPEAAEEYTASLDLMTAQVNRAMTSQPDLERIIGRNSRQAMLDNHANHGRFMSSLLAEFKPDVLVDTVIWVFRAYQSRGFSADYWKIQLNTWLAVLEKNLTTHAFASISPVYLFILDNLESFASIARQDLKAC